MIVNSSLPLGTITISLREAGRCFNSCETGQQPSAGSGCGAHSERSSPPVPAPLPQPGSGRWVGVTAAARGWPRGGIHGDVPSPRPLALGIPRCAAAALVPPPPPRRHPDRRAWRQRRSQEHGCGCPQSASVSAERIRFILGVHGRRGEEQAGCPPPIQDSSPFLHDCIWFGFIGILLRS